VTFPAGPERDDSSDEESPGPQGEALPEVTCSGGVRLPQIGAGVG
jgi:hypothetical protein